jgi:hypothetical protein
VTFATSRMTPIERKRLQRFALAPKSRVRVRWGRIALLLSAIAFTVLVIEVPGSRPMFSTLLIVNLLGFALSNARAYPPSRKR